MATLIDITDMTFAAYRKFDSLSLRGEYRISVAEYEEFYPRLALLTSWMEALEQAAWHHKRLRDAVLDSFVRECGEDAYLRTFRGRAFQEGYILPSARRRNREAPKLYRPRRKSA